VHHSSASWSCRAVFPRATFVPHQLILSGSWKSMVMQLDLPNPRQWLGTWILYGKELSRALSLMPRDMIIAKAATKRCRSLDSASLVRV
jgi:hypothetical protein